MRIIFLYFLLWFAITCSMGLRSFSQGNTRVSASVDKNRILIGEPVTLTLEVEVPGDERIRFFILDSIPHFEFLEKNKIDTADLSDGTRLRQLLRITSFDSGTWTIPAFVLGNGEFTTDSITIEVGHLPMDPAKDYNDIKDILPVKVEEEKPAENWKWIIPLVVLLLAGVLWMTRKKKKPVVSYQANHSAYEKAMKALDLLSREEMPVKVYYTRLVDIFREYIFASKGIHSMRRTTDELVVQLRSVAMPQETGNRLAQALRQSDFVKFARYEPAAADNEFAFTSVKRAIGDIESATPKTS